MFLCAVIMLFGCGHEAHLVVFFVFLSCVYCVLFVVVVVRVVHKLYINELSVNCPLIIIFFYSFVFSLVVLVFTPFCVDDVCGLDSAVVPLQRR